MIFLSYKIQQSNIQYFQITDIWGGIDIQYYTVSMYIYMISDIRIYVRC